MSRVAAVLQQADPAFYDMLMQQDVSQFQPDVARTSELLRTMRRHECRHCQAGGVRHKCSTCRVAHYCNVECQRADWEAHQKVCAVDRVIGEALKEALEGGDLVV